LSDNFGTGAHVIDVPGLDVRDQNNYRLVHKAQKTFPNSLNGGIIEGRRG
jgi:hypothetical protein